jgi:hypothetical protein
MNPKVRSRERQERVVVKIGGSVRLSQFSLPKEVA